MKKAIIFNAELHLLISYCYNVCRQDFQETNLITELMPFKKQF
jgi:hypothetical protein